MTKKVFWVFLTLLTVMALILTSCGKESTTGEETTVVTGTVTETTSTEVVKPVETTIAEKPKYGGILSFAGTTDISSFDDMITNHNVTYTLNMTNDELLQGDWTKGPAGTGETDFVLGSINNMSLKTGSLADSWQIPQKGKIIFHIREGVYWHNKPPTSGRALTVDDVVFTLNRDIKNPASYIKLTYPNFSNTAVITGDEAARTVTIECPTGEWAQLITLIPNFYSIFPRDAVEKFGDMKDWRNSIGTGPFIMTDYVSGGSVTYIRNPNYWETNPIGPGKGDKLPYLECVKYLIVPDSATYFAAFRTAKIDSAGGEYDDVKEFLENPDIKSLTYISDTAYCMYMRTDKADSPFSKLEVRQALTMAIDFNKIKDEYYNGRAEILVWPISPTKESVGAYVPLEKLPANVQELYSHNVTKAKALLTTAGYSTGFPAKVICYNTPTHTDFLSLVKGMWAEVGVNLTIDAKDYTTWMSRTRTRTYDDLLYTYDAGPWWKMLNFTGVSQYNGSYVNDTRANEAMARAIEYIGYDEAKLYQNNSELMPYVLEQCWAIGKPIPRSYVIWWPWVKNWHGELYIGYYTYPIFNKYRSMDVALKRQMTGKK